VAQSVRCGLLHHLGSGTFHTANTTATLQSTWLQAVSLAALFFTVLRYWRSRRQGIDVRYSPESGHWRRKMKCPLWAINDRSSQFKEHPAAQRRHSEKD
jgi:hypothetical protein